MGNGIEDSEEFIIEKAEEYTNAFLVLVAAAAKSLQQDDSSYIEDLVTHVIESEQYSREAIIMIATIGAIQVAKLMHLDDRVKIRVKSDRQ